MTLPSNDARFYDAAYFAHGCGEPYGRTTTWLNLFGGIADAIVREIGPRRVLDAGCAMGLLVEALRDRGVEAYGLDFSDYALQQVRPDIRPYCRLASITEPLAERYDLVVCIEVLEHLPPGEGEAAIANLCGAAGDLLISSTPHDFTEATHLNVQPPEHWAERFAVHHYVRDVDFDASFITPWAMRLRLTTEPWQRVVRGYERKFWRLWEENVALRRQVVAQRNPELFGGAPHGAVAEQLAACEAQIAQLEARVKAYEESRLVRWGRRLGRLLGRGPGGTGQA